MNWPWRQRVVVLDQQPLPDKELAAAFAVAESTLWFRAVMQVIGDLEREAFLAKTADNRDDGMGGHWISLVKQKRLYPLKPDR